MNHLFAISITFLLIACKEEVDNKSRQDPPLNTDNPSALNVPDGFDYKMDRDITFKLQVLDHNGFPGQFIGIQIFEQSGQEVIDEDSSEPTHTTSATLIFSGQTNEMGYLEEIIQLPMHLENVQVQASQLGINNRVTLNTKTNTNVIFHEFN